MDPDKTLGIARTMVRAWEEASNTDAEHAAARELSSAFGALDDFLSNGGILPHDWSAQYRFQVLGMIQEFVKAASNAMRAEDTDPARHDRVVNRLLWGDPDGPAGVQAEAEAARLSTDPDTSVWHLVTGNPVAPHLTHPVFGRDFREIDPGEIDGPAHHPLIATCGCGEEIMRDTPSQEWHHTDPRL